MKLSLGPYAKFVTAIIGQAIAFASLYWGGTADAKYVAVGIAVASALGVYAVPNQPKAGTMIAGFAEPAAPAAPLIPGRAMFEVPSNVTVVPPAQGTPT